jgi:hypothetical protein
MATIDVGFKFTKNQLVESRQYQNQKDVLNAVLDKDRSYTLKEVNALVKKYMKGKVN